MKKITDDIDFYKNVSYCAADIEGKMRVNLVDGRVLTVYGVGQKDWYKFRKNKRNTTLMAIITSHHYEWEIINFSQ